MIKGRSVGSCETYEDKDSDADSSPAPVDDDDNKSDMVNKDSSSSSTDDKDFLESPAARLSHDIVLRARTTRTGNLTRQFGCVASSSSSSGL